MSAAPTAAPPALPTVPIRKARISDRGFVLDAWHRSYESEHFDELRRKLRARIGARAARSDIHVAYDPEDPNTIAGYAVVEGTTLHYVYVRSGLRKLGIARQLLEHVPIEAYSTTTRAFRDRIRPDTLGWKHLEGTEE